MAGCVITHKLSGLVLPPSLHLAPAPLLPWQSPLPRKGPPSLLAGPGPCFGQALQAQPPGSVCGWGLGRGVRKELAREPKRGGAAAS